MKVLADPDRPSEPLYNVRANYPTAPSFGYRFRGVSPESTWNEATGFGSQIQAIKYFDTTVAIKHATGAVQPRSVVEVSAFRLEVFDYAGRFVSAFQNVATRRITQEISRLQLEIDTAKQGLSATADISAPPFDQWSATNSHFVAEYLDRRPAFGIAQSERLAELTRALGQYTAASSDEGLKSLRAQHALLEQLASQLTSLSELCASAPLATLQATETQVNQKRAASVELSRGAFPHDVNSQLHHSLLHAAAAICDLSAFRSGEHACPLCRQLIGPEAVELFKIYHEYLTSTLQNEIANLERILRSGRETLERVRAFRLSDFAMCREPLAEGALQSIVATVEAVVTAVPPGDQPLATGDSTAYSRVESLTGQISLVRRAQRNLAESIKIGTENRQEIVNRISQTQNEVAGLRAHQAV